MAKTGANYTRVLADFKAGMPKSRITEWIALARTHGMILEIGLSGTDFDNPEIKPLLIGNEDVVIIHAHGESTVDSDDDWKTEAKNRITWMRNLGYKHVFFVGSRNFGRNPHTVLNHGAEIVEHDPLHRIILFVQLYWGWNDDKSGNFYEQKYGMTVAQAIEKFAQKNFPIQAGINARDNGGYPWIDYKTLLQECEDHQISWLWWDWWNPYSGNLFSVSSSGKYGDWMVWNQHPFGADVGYQTAIGHAASVKNTSVRSQYLVMGNSCSGVSAAIDAQPLAGPYPLTVSLDASGSEGEGLNYAWEFGDGQNGSGATIDHIFQSAGEYTVRLVVSNKDDSDTARTTIRVFDPATEPVLLSTLSATASSEENSQFGGHLTATNAIDGKLGTRWASNATDNEWIYLDLASAQPFNRIILHWENAYGSGYTIQVSEDAQSWTDIFTESSGDGGVDTINVGATARYVRMLGIARGTEWGYSLYEFEIYSIPDATFLAHQKVSFAPTKARDGISGRVFDIRGRMLRSAASQPAGDLPWGIYILENGNQSLRKLRTVHIR
jgi:PKD repeat protein